MSASSNRTMAVVVVLAAAVLIALGVYLFTASSPEPPTHHATPSALDGTNPLADPTPDATNLTGHHQTPAPTGNQATPPSNGPDEASTPPANSQPTPPIETQPERQPMKTTVVGRAIDGESGAPIHGPLTIAVQWPGETKTATATAKSSDVGTFRTALTVEDAGDPLARAQLRISATGTDGGKIEAAIGASLMRDRVTDLGTILLFPGTGSATISGSVLASGEAVAGATLTLYDARSKGGDGLMRILGFTRSDDAGAFIFEQVRPGKYFVAANAAGFAVSFSSPVTLEDKGTANLTIAMLAGFTVRGTVTTATEPKEPIEGVSVVVAQALPGAMLDVVVVEVGETDAAGHYEIQNIAANGYIVIAEKAGFANSVENMAISGDTTQDFELKPAGHTLVGRVVDKDGQPIPLFSIRVWKQSDNPQSGEEVAGQLFSDSHNFENAEGRFQIANLEAGMYAAEVIDHIHARTIQRNIPVGPAEGGENGGEDGGENSGESNDESTGDAKAVRDEVVIVMADGNTLMGRVLTTGDSPNPVAGARVCVALTMPVGRGMEFPFAESNDVFAISGKDGAYRLTGLPTGSLHVWVTHPDYPQLRETVPMGEGGEVERDFALQADPARIFGRVYDLNGDLRAGVMVFAQTQMMARFTTTTDERGNYAIENLPAGQFSVFAYDTAAQQLVGQQFGVQLAGGDNLEINLGKPKSLDTTMIVGTITDDGQPLAGAAVNLASMKPGEEEIVVSTTNPQGVFNAKVKPGKYSVLVQYHGGGRTLNFRVEIVVPLLDKFEVQIAVPKTELIGRLIDASTNQPIAEGVELVLEPANAPSGEVTGLGSLINRYAGQINVKSADGNFKWTGIAPGKYHLRGYAEGFGLLVVRNIDVPAFGTHNLGDLFFTSESTLVLTVADGAGQPVPGAVLSIIDDEGKNLTMINSFVTQPDGKVTVHFLKPETTYSITATAPGYAPGRLEFATGATLKQELALTVAVGGTLQITVTNAAAAPQPNLKVDLLGPDGKVVPPIYSQASLYGTPTHTDPKGQVTRGSLVPGPYVIVVTRDGKTYNAEITVAASGPHGEPTTITVTLPD